MYSSIRQLYCCDITDIRRVPPEWATYTKIMNPLKNSYLLIGLSKFAQTFAVRFLKSSSIHPICIYAWGSFSFKPRNLRLHAWINTLSACMVISYDPGGGWGVGSLAHKLSTHPRPSTSKMNPKWRIAPCYISTLNGVRPAKLNPKWRILIVMVLRKIH